jgi:hypothetical protein
MSETQSLSLAGVIEKLLVYAVAIPSLDEVLLSTRKLLTLQLDPEPPYLTFT